MLTHIISGYLFIALADVATLRQRLLTTCSDFALKGTVLLSQEGINMNLAGTENAIQSFMAWLQQDARFAAMTFHQHTCSATPFQRLKVKIKKEIITFKVPAINPVTERAPALTAAVLKQWLDENRDITLLDTRNDYEIAAGTFTQAVNLNLADFTGFPAALTPIEKNKPVVMFCTGGIRCEKAALYMLQQGYPEVYQLAGGILAYFAEVGREHFQGKCFVFDGRESV